MKSREPAEQISPWQKKNAHEYALKRCLEVGIGEDDVRRFATELERNLFQIARRGANEDTAHFGAAGEGNLVNVVVVRERRSRGLAEAGDDVEYSIGEAGAL